MKLNIVLWLVAILLIIGGSSTIVVASIDNNSENKPIPRGLHDGNMLELKDKSLVPDSFAKNKKKYAEPIHPVHIEIPAIGVDAPVVPTGLNDEQEMIVPKNGEEVAWFEPGSRPGEIGNSVLAGHVDDYTGPAVFFYLEKLSAGDEIIITGENGEELTFVVEKLEAYPKDDAPLRKIFGTSDARRLNLVTCTGVYNRDIQSHEERLVVYTKQKEQR